MKDKAIIFDLYDTLMQVTKRTNGYIDLRQLIDKRMASDECTAMERREMTLAFRYLFLTTPTSTDIVADVLSCQFFKERPYLESIVQESVDIQQQNDIKEAVEEEVASVRPFHNAEHVVQQLHKKYNLVLVSNLASPFRRPFLDSAIAPYFNASIFSCEVGMIKPDKRMFEMAISKCDVDLSKIIVIGDKLHTDGVGAQDCGLHYFKSHGGRTFLDELIEFI